ncbi:hypothetical protein FA15DRAFT_701836 [Coprinopsis marcescibilis]|uniref:Uncharacterized protein n=1 Tax=Coprinopsis marcescibilis TaxID=230819 RepID=A0A5C3L670_COPMA|nr:hypothetical protein FA15DRAFT_701836 [Coprinopsis marcescibilis]
MQKSLKKPGQEARPPGRASCRLTVEHTKAARAEVNELVEWVCKHPTISDKDLKKEKEKYIARILALDSFQATIVEGATSSTSTPVYKKALELMINNDVRRKGPQERVKRRKKNHSVDVLDNDAPAAQSSSLTAPSTNDMSPPPAVPSDVNPSPTSLVFKPNDLTQRRRSFIILQGEYPARDLFIDENLEAIKAIEPNIQKERNLHGSGLRHAAATQLFTPELQKIYKDKARNLKSNIPENQQYFAYVLSDALRDATATGLIGSVAVKVHVATRDEFGGINGQM